MGRIGAYLERRRLRKMQARWAALANSAATLDRGSLRTWQGRARAMRREIDRVLHAAEARLSEGGKGLPAMPLGTDWAWRPDLWRGTVPRRWAVLRETRTEISDDVALHHDCTEPQMIARQVRGEGAAPCALMLETFGFDGGFLSVAVQMPLAAVEGLKSRHLLRVAVTLDSERRVKAFARLNIKHGPNTEHMVLEMSGALVEFDLAYAKFDDKRVESMWLDLIFDRPAMNAITVQDVTVSRRPRAEL